MSITMAGPSAQPGGVAPTPPNPLRHPARALAAVGVAMLSLAAFMPWATMWDVFDVRTVVGGFDGAADGVTELIIGAVLLAFLASRGAAGTTIRTLQLIPAGIGIAAMFIALDAYRFVEGDVGAAASNGGRAVVEPGMWLLVAGGVLAAIGGAASTFVVARAHPPRRDPADRRSFDRAFGAVLLVGTGGAIVGGFAGAQVVLGVFGEGSIQASIGTIYAIIIGGTIGAGVAVGAWRRLHPVRRAGAR